MSFERRLNRHDISRRPAESDPANERLLNREDYSRRKAEQPRYPAETTTPTQGCNPCNPVTEETLTVDLGGGLLAAEEYLFSPLCDGSMAWRFVWDSGGTWIGEIVDDTFTCGEEEIEVSATMVVTIVDGKVICTITIKDGADAILALYVGLTAFQPCDTLKMTLEKYDPRCTCLPWDQTPCVAPVLAA